MTRSIANQAHSTLLTSTTMWTYTTSLFHVGNENLRRMHMDDSKTTDKGKDVLVQFLRTEKLVAHIVTQCAGSTKQRHSLTSPKIAYLLRLQRYGILDDMARGNKSPCRLKRLNSTFYAQVEGINQTPSAMTAYRQQGTLQIFKEQHQGPG